MYSLPIETPTLLASCFGPTTKESIAIRENASEQKVQSISDKKIFYLQEDESSMPHLLPYCITSRNIHLSAQLSATYTMLQDKVLVPSEAELGAVQKE